MNLPYWMYTRATCHVYDLNYARNLLVPNSSEIPAGFLPDILRLMSPLSTAFLMLKLEIVVTLSNVRLLILGLFDCHIRTLDPLGQGQWCHQIGAANSYHKL